MRVARSTIAFGIGVVDHHGLAVLRLEDISREYGLVADGVLGEAADGAHVDGEFEGGDGLDGGKYGGRTAHVANHLGHGLGRFEAEAAGVEGEALADEDEVVLGVELGGLVIERHHVGLVRTALADGHVPHEAFLFELLHVAYLHGEARSVFRDCLRILVDEVLCEHDCLVLDGDFFGNFLEGRGMFAGDDLVGHLEVRLLLCLVGVELVFGVVEPVEDCLELFVCAVGEHEAHAADLFFHGAAGEAVACHAQVVEVRESAFLGGVHENSRFTVNFEVFEVLEGAVLHAVKYRFDLFFADFCKDIRKLDGLLYEKECVGVRFA